MSRRILPARFITSPDILGMAYAAGQTFTIGAALALDGAQNIIEAVSPIVGPTLVGFAGQEVDTNPGYQLPNANVNVFTTYKTAKIAVFRANRLQVFAGILVNNSSVAIAVTQADVGINYGLKSYNVATPFGLKNVWFVDKFQVGANACVTIIGFDTTPGITGLVYFKVMEARLAMP